jgi:glycine/D-amino acid oxidase-like deaminating enzyme
MPALSRPKSTVTINLPARKGQIAAEADVLVVGGGPAGLGAALGAADAGVDVILVERYGFLGGSATTALESCFMSFYTPSHEHKPFKAHLLYPQDHGPAQPVIAGVVSKFMNLLLDKGGAVPPSMDTGYITSFDPEIFKLAASELIDQAGVKFLLHAFASGVINTAGLEGVILETKSGPLVIKAKVIVDCTGDGDIAALAGAPFQSGREGDGLTQPMSLLFRMTGFNRDKFVDYVRNHPVQWNGVQGLYSLIAKATAEGKLDLPREDILFFGTPYDNEVSVNSTRVSRVSGVDVWDMSYAEEEGRRQAHHIARFLKEYVPGFENTIIIQTGTNIGVRETRRIMGEYVLTAADILEARKFEDVVARGSYPIDIHSPDGKGTVLRRLPRNEAYDIPLRCLIPRKVDNLLMAGRCISGTHEAQSSYRIIPISIATGQAAGVCAALSVKQSKLPRSMEYQFVQRELLRQGADLREIIYAPSPD